MPGVRAPGEGLWPLDLVEVPVGVRDAAQGVVRVGGSVRFRVRLHATPEDADRARFEPGVLDKAGRVLGVYRDSTHRDGEFDLRVAGYDGIALITPVACLPDWVRKGGWIE